MPRPGSTRSRPSRMINQEFTLRCLLVGAMFTLTACADVVAPPPVPGPRVEMIVADTNDHGNVLLTVRLDHPGVVQVDYWNDPRNILQLRVPATRSSAQVFVSRMEAGATYHYEVRGLADNGEAGEAVEGFIGAPGLPADLQVLSFKATGTPTSPLTMLEVSATFRGFVVVDGVGKVVWWWRTEGAPRGFARRSNGNFVLNDYGNRLIEVTPDGQEVRELRGPPDGSRTAHHDVIVTPQNTLLFIALDTRALADTTLAGDAIWEWNPEDGTVIKRWSTFDFYDPARDIGNRSTRADWVHANSLAMGDHGNVILSLNWLSQCISIAPGWQSIEWRLGGRRSDFALDAGPAFQGQHTVQTLPSGHVLMMDNGRDRTAPDAWSRALELELNPATHVATRTWEFRASPEIFAPIVGSARRLANGNTLVQFGTRQNYGGPSTGPIVAFEVTHSGTVVWRLKTDNADVVYRATPMLSISGESEAH